MLERSRLDSKKVPGMPDRFSNRVRDYVRYRPGYATEAIDLLARELPLRRGITVADVGAGTGILTRQVAATGARVLAIDPSEPMLDAARAALRADQRIEFRVGTAESTDLPDASVDAIVAGQAFHWFDHRRARVEIERVLRPGGKVALVWNAKAFDRSPFLRDYEALLESRLPEFSQVRHEKTGAAELHEFFGTDVPAHRFPHAQRFDWSGVLGRALSASYAPAPGSPLHESFVAELAELFAAHADDGVITWPYTTTVHVGPLA